MSNILVTGGAGFIGFHTTKYLLSKGHKIIIVDSISESYYNVSYKIKRLGILCFHETEFKPNTIYTNANSSVYLIKADLSNPEEYYSLLDCFTIDYVIHLGSHASVLYSLQHPDRYIKDIVGFYNILDYAQKHSVKNFVFASSSSVYGKYNPAPFLEEYPIDNPISIYAASKVCDEIIAKTYCSIYPISITALRFFTVYGPCGRPDMAVHKFVQSIYTGEPITINGDGCIRRSYTYIDDVVESIYRATFNPQTDNKYRVFNVGNEETVSILELISCIEKISGKKAILHFQEGVSVDMPITAASMDKFYKTFGYRSEFNTERGITKFISWFRTYYNI